LPDVRTEGYLLLDLMEVWGVPKTEVQKLKSAVAKKLDDASKNLVEGRSALHVVFSETDDWDDFVDDYEATVQTYTHWLFGSIVGLSFLASLLLHVAHYWPPTWLLCALLAGGAAGSCASVIAKMPKLDASIKGELSAYGRVVWSRIGTGMVASVIGCAALGWLTVSVRNQAFADAINECARLSCTGMNALLLFAVPMLLGFSERTLTSFEQTLLGGSSKARR
jgi:hypothetical protein